MNKCDKCNSTKTSPVTNGAGDAVLWRCRIHIGAARLLLADYRERTNSGPIVHTKPTWQRRESTGTGWPT